MSLGFEWYRKLLIENKCKKKKKTKEELIKPAYNPLLTNLNLSTCFIHPTILLNVTTYHSQPKSFLT